MALTASSHQPKNPITYRINYQKAIETIIWIAQQKPGIDIYHIAKILFYADKLHVNRYARPITGDHYICMDYGPVPSGIKDLIDKNSWLNPIYLSEVSKSIQIDKEPYTNIKALRPPRMDYFSKTDIECLELSLEEYGDKTFDELFELTHDEKCSINTGTNQPIDYTLLVDDDNPHKDEIINEISQSYACLTF